VNLHKQKLEKLVKLGQRRALINTQEMILVLLPLTGVTVVKHQPRLRTTVVIQTIQVVFGVIRQTPVVAGNIAPYLLANQRIV